MRRVLYAAYSHARQPPVNVQKEREKRAMDKKAAKAEEPAKADK